MLSEDRLKGREGNCCREGRGVLLVEIQRRMRMRCGSETDAFRIDREIETMAEARL